MSKRAARLLAIAAALGGAAVAATAARAATTTAPYTLAATESCLTALPNAVAGLPPATPPVPSRFFVHALAHDGLPIAVGAGPRPRPHRRLAVWYGDGRYRGIVLSFFETVDDARASSKTLAGPSGGTLVRNVVVTWDRRPGPKGSVRATVLACLRSRPVGGHPAKRPPPKATLATFAGGWGGHTRGLSITSTGRGRERADDGCCQRVYRLTFRILSVSGTLTRAAAVYRVTSFERFGGGTAALHVGDVGRLVLRNGIVTNTLTRDFFCSDPAWGATGACGA